MKRIKLCLFYLLPLLVAGCVASSQHFVRPSSNLNGFRYVFISPITYEDGMIDKYGLGMRLADMFMKEGVQVLDEYEVKELPRKVTESIRLLLS